MYGDDVISEGGMWQWCIIFKNGSIDVDYEKDSGSDRPTLVTDDLVEKIHENIEETRRFTTSELSFEFLRISRSLLHEIVKKKTSLPQVLSRMGAETIDRRAQKTADSCIVDIPWGVQQEWRLTSRSCRNTVDKTWV